MPSLRARRPSALALMVLAVLGCAAGLAGAQRPTHRAEPWRVIVVSADELSGRRVPSFELIPLSRRDEAVLRSQPELQILAAGTTSTRSKPARGQAARSGRHAALHAGAHRSDTDGADLRPSGVAAARLRAPPSPG